MNGDGKAGRLRTPSAPDLIIVDHCLDYVWVDPITGETRCWLNNLPNPWSPAGNNNSIIASGAGPGKSVFFAVSSFSEISSAEVDTNGSRI